MALMDAIDRIRSVGDLSLWRLFLLQVQAHRQHGGCDEAVTFVLAPSAVLTVKRTFAMPRTWSTSRQTRMRPEIISGS